ncbi:MAG: hypothetical protein HY748_05040 [Elusimicrobia bacterium]|nr:hypothetical protein [Elusimicrobiota bacterium]
MTRKENWNDGVALPPGLTVAAIRKSIQYVEKESSELVEIYLEQANVFSAIMGIFGAKALDAFSVYEKSKDSNVAQQRFPDLRRRGSGRNPPPDSCLESKASKRPWALQSHYDHAGWYVIWRYWVDPTMSVDPGRSVTIWRVEVVRLEKNDWKYEGSGAGKQGGGRTHTFGLRWPAEKLRDKAVYERLDIRIQGGKVVPANGE